jgi:hypothetical protein
MLPNGAVALYNNDKRHFLEDIIILSKPFIPSLLISYKVGTPVKRLTDWSNDFFYFIYFVHFFVFVCLFCSLRFFTFIIMELHEHVYYFDVEHSNLICVWYKYNLYPLWKLFVLLDFKSKRYCICYMSTYDLYWQKKTSDAPLCIISGTSGHLSRIMAFRKQQCHKGSIFVT